MNSLGWGGVKMRGFTKLFVLIILKKAKKMEGILSLFEMLIGLAISISALT